MYTIDHSLTLLFADYEIDSMPKESIDYNIYSDEMGLSALGLDGYNSGFDPMEYTDYNVPSGQGDSIVMSLPDYSLDNVNDDQYPLNHEPESATIEAKPKPGGLPINSIDYQPYQYFPSGQIRFDV